MNVKELLSNLIHIIHFGIGYLLLIIIYFIKDKKILYLLLLLYITLLILWIIFYECILTPIEQFLQNSEERNFIFFLKYFNVNNKIQRNIAISIFITMTFIIMIKIYILHIKSPSK
jgi:hypothetical protein